jgi:Zn-dependent alcohol dehydrogenase
MLDRAVISDGTGGFAVHEVEVGEPGPDEVLVELAASGVCHTDHDLCTGVPLPMILGHEGAGTVRAVGDEVGHVTPGDRVILTWAIGCGDCYQCTQGSRVLCETRGITPGGHARFDATTHDGNPVLRAFNLGTMSTATVVRQEAVVRLAADISFESACLLGCGVMTGYGSVVNAAQLEPGASAVVLGCGGVGLNVIQSARIAGADPVIAVDLTSDRLETARRFGATETIEASADDVGLTAAAAAVRAMTGGRGADYAFACTGVPELAAAPLAMVRNGGTAIQVSGVEQEISVDMRLFEWDKTYLNPLYGQCRPEVDFPALFSLYEQGQLLLDELVTRTYALDDAAEAFDDLLAGRNARGVILL